MAKKTLQEMLLERAERSELTGRWAAFVVAWEEIKEAYEKGWKYKDIWIVLREAGGFDYSYASFMACVKRMKQRQGEIAAGGVVNPTPRSGKVHALPKTSNAPALNRGGLPLFGEGVKEQDSRRF